MSRQQRRRRGGSGAASPHIELAEVERLARAGDLERAATLVEQIVHATPGVAAAWHLKGVLALGRSDAAGAVKALARAAALAPADPAIMSNLGIARHRTGDRAAARKTLEALVAIAPGFAPGRLNLAIVLRDAGETGAAITELREATRLDPGYARAWLELGILLGERGAFEDALACLARAGGSDEAQAAQGVCLQELGRVDEALRIYRQMVRRDPSLYPVVERNLTTASKGRLWLHPAALRAALFGQHGFDYGRGARQRLR